MQAATHAHRSGATVVPTLAAATDAATIVADATAAAAAAIVAAIAAVAVAAKVPDSPSQLSTYFVMAANADCCMFL